MLQKVSIERDSLSRAEQRVADWVLANPRRSVELPLAALASAARVSEPTVVRFCRSMGVSGYRAFKTSLVTDLHRPENYLHSDVDEGDSSEAAVGKVLDSAIKALVDLRNQASAFPFDDAVDRLLECRQVVFAGLGASGHVAEDARHKFFRLGLPCSAAVDAQTAIQAAAIAGPTDVLIAVSHSGRWPDLVSSMRVAKERGAFVLALTDPSAPLAQEASLVFACHPSEDRNIFTPMNSRLVHLALLDALQVTLALRMGATAEANLRLSKEALQGLVVTG